MSETEQPDKKPDGEAPPTLNDIFRGMDFQSIFSQAGRETGGARAGAAQSAEHAEKLRRIREFNLKPRQIRDHLDRFIVQQAEAKKVISVTICDHYNHVRQCLANPALREKTYAKPNLLLLGPTGVGKTYLIRCISRLVGVPFVKADATKFSETGYVGHDVEDLVRDLVKAANGDVDLAQYGIIYLDEVDKIAAAASQEGRDVSGRGVQVNLLKLMEETDVPLQSQTDLLGQMEAVMQLQRTGTPARRTISTRHVLFIVSGVFDRLAEQVRRRLGSLAIGFKPGATPEVQDGDYLRRAQTSDFINCGFEPEFIGRIPVRVTCDSLSEEDLERILLSSEDNVFEQYQRDFEGYGIQLSATREAIREIARLAHEEQTGARGIMTVLEQTLRNAKFELPSTAIRSFEITTDMVHAPGKALRDILHRHMDSHRQALRDEIDAYCRSFRETHGLELQFEEAALDSLLDQSLALDKTIRALCEDRFKDFHHGLKLIAQNTGQTCFHITPAVIESPDRELSRWVVESYKKAPGSATPVLDGHGHPG